MFMSLQKYKKRGTLGFSVLRIWPICVSVFLFSLLKTALFPFWCFVRFAGFLQFSLWFSVFVNNDGSFLDQGTLRVPFMMVLTWGTLRARYMTVTTGGHFVHVT